MARRADRQGEHRSAFEKNRKKIFATHQVCAICGKPVDFKLKAPAPMSPTVDHIVPISRGGHPSDISNLQLAHWICNRMKSNQIANQKYCSAVAEAAISNRILPQSCDWKTF